MSIIRADGKREKFNLPGKGSKVLDILDQLKQSGILAPKKTTPIQPRYNQQTPGEDITVKTGKGGKVLVITGLSVVTVAGLIALAKKKRWI